MSRQLRAGEASKPWAFRITAAERRAWELAARVEDCSTLSAWAVKTLNARAARVTLTEAGKPLSGTTTGADKLTGRRSRRAVGR